MISVGARQSPPFNSAGSLEGVQGPGGELGWYRRPGTLLASRSPGLLDESNSRSASLRQATQLFAPSRNFARNAVSIDNKVQLSAPACISDSLGRRCRPRPVLPESQSSRVWPFRGVIVFFPALACSLARIDGPWIHFDLLPTSHDIPAGLGRPCWGQRLFPLGVYKALRLPLFLPQTLPNPVRSTTPLAAAHRPCSSIVFSSSTSVSLDHQHHLLLLFKQQWPVEQQSLALAPLGPSPLKDRSTLRSGASQLPRRRNASRSRISQSHHLALLPLGILVRSHRCSQQALPGLLLHHQAPVHHDPGSLPEPSPSDGQS